MDSKFSLVIKGIVVMLLGFLFGKLNVDVGEEQLTTFVETALTLIGAGMAWYGRWRHGDITSVGFRKEM